MLKVQRSLIRVDVQNRVDLRREGRQEGKKAKRQGGKKAAKRCKVQ